MWSWLRSYKDTLGLEAQALYVAAVNAAREPLFYTENEVPDTLDGRFEVLSLHVALLILRLQPENSELAQALFDVFFKDMDRSARERGVGDLSVPKQIKLMMRSFNGRLIAYQVGLHPDAPPEALLDAVRRNVFGTNEHPKSEAIRRIAEYMRALAALLQMRKMEEVSRKESLDFAPVDVLKRAA